MLFSIGLGDFQDIQRALSVICLSLFAVFLVKLFNARMHFIRLKSQGLSMPPHHPIFGHLLLAKNLLSQMPADAHPTYLPGLIRKAFPDVGHIFYLDMWPFGRPLLIVSSPSVVQQFTQERPLHKAAELRTWIKPLANNQDLVSLEGPKWKKWRGVYNPGFSASHLIHLVPQIAQEVLVFCDILKERAQCEAVFPLEESTVKLTMDVIGRVVLDARFNSQRSRNEFVSALRAQIPWNTTGTEMNPFVRWNPLRPLFHAYYILRMNRYMSRQLEHRFAAYQDLGDSAGDRGSAYRTVVDRALNEYLEDQLPGTNATRSIDADFKRFAVSQMKVFILAGHDTTSSTLCYVYYMLSRNPTALQRVRAEHDDIFGSDTTRSQAAITANPHALNHLPFTLAVIKETLRLFPPASTTRDGEPGFSLTTRDGHNYPTEGSTIWCSHQSLHREPLYWPQPDSFIPERWLVAEGDPLHPVVKGAWRPFEWGPRNCIGQELALLELKLVMVMTLRDFNIKASYDSWDLAHHEKKTKEPRTVSGERAYYALKGTTRPVDGFPARVTIAKR